MSGPMTSRRRASVLGPMALMMFSVHSLSRPTSFVVCPLVGAMLLLLLLLCERGGEMDNGWLSEGHKAV